MPPPSDILDMRPLDDRPGLGARLHIGLLKLVRAVATPFRYRGLGVFCIKASRIFGATAPLVQVKLATGGRFCMPVYDVAWQAYLYRNRIYEPELETFLRGISDMPFDYLDCGANFGYWSAWLSGLRGQELGQIIAIEPSPSCLPVLRQTAALNAPRIKLVENAMHSTAGETLAFLVSHFHVASHVVEKDWEGPAPENIVEVTTVSLDALAEEFGLGPRALVIKLDVEGQEANTISGAGRLDAADVVYLYEDHGKDSECEASAYLLEHGFAVFALTDKAQIRMQNIAEIAAFKTNPNKGYNFAATRSALWMEHLGRQA